MDPREAERLRHAHQVILLERDYEAERQEQRARAARLIVIGILAILFGLAITVITYDAAMSAGGGRYVIAYGPVVFGVISVIRGVIARAS
jgi:uncharacterized membrane protein